MPPYLNSTFGPPYKKTLRMQYGVVPIYLFGRKDSQTNPFVFKVTQVALTSNVATLTVQLVSGGGGAPNDFPASPQVGQNLSVLGTQTASGAFNVGFTQVTASTVDPTTGAGTISFALMHANVGATADSGQLVLEPLEIPDLVDSVTASIPVAQIFTPDDSDNSRCIFAEAKWTGTLPTSATIKLQVANVDEDSRYQVVQNSYGTAPGAIVAQSDSLATVAAGAVTQSGAQYQYIMGKFIRAKITAITGGDNTTGLILTLFG
ncbi:MAG TPA: hypothetical protein VFB43_18020 [Terracidiphilus sp.]|nr:hypothetical protein [Terracidiphilus sp.]